MASSAGIRASSASIWAQSTMELAGATPAASRSASRVGQRILVDVEDIDERLRGEQVEVVEQIGVDLALAAALEMVRPSLRMRWAAATASAAASQLGTRPVLPWPVWAAGSPPSAGRPGSARCSRWRCRTRGRPDRRRGSRRRRERRGPPGRWRRSPGWRPGTCCPAPPLVTLPGRCRRCRRRSPTPARSARRRRARPASPGGRRARPRPRRSDRWWQRGSWPPGPRCW